MKSEAGAIPVVCVPAAIPAAERSAHFVLTRKLFAELAGERRDLPGGYAFRLEVSELENVAKVQKSA